MLDNYLNKPAPQMLGDLSAQYTKEQEDYAKQMGFPSYEAMRLWQKQRSRKREGTDTAPGEMPSTWDEVKEQAMAWHPKVIFQKIADILGDINSK